MYFKMIWSYICLQIIIIIIISYFKPYNCSQKKSDFDIK